MGKSNMKCDCCGKKKGFFESFSLIKTKQYNLNLCARCNNIEFKIRDYSALNNKEEVNKALIQIDNLSKDKCSKKFEEWHKEFVNNVIIK